MAHVTQVSAVESRRDPPPPRRTVQIVPIVDGRAALTFVEWLAPPPRE